MAPGEVPSRSRTLAEPATIAAVPFAGTCNIVRTSSTGRSADRVEVDAEEVGAEAFGDRLPPDQCVGHAVGHSRGLEMSVAHVHLEEALLVHVPGLEEADDRREPARIPAGRGRRVR